MKRTVFWDVAMRSSLQVHYVSEENSAFIFRQAISQQGTDAKELW
jgi:hypothetical protein